MIATYIVIWLLIYLCLKYDLKQSNVKSLLRATLFTLLAYVSIDMVYREGLALDAPSTNDIDVNEIIVHAQNKKKKHKRCKYLRQQQALTLQSFNQGLRNISNTSLSESNYISTNLETLRATYNNQFDIVQKSFNDLYAMQDRDRLLNCHTFPWQTTTGGIAST